MPQDHRSDFPNSSDVNVVDVSRFAFQLKRSFLFFFYVKTQMAVHSQIRSTRHHFFSHRARVSASSFWHWVGQNGT